MRSVWVFMAMLLVAASANGGPYTDAEERRRVCSNASGLAEYLWDFRARADRAKKNLMLAEKELPTSLRNMLDPGTPIGESVFGKITRDIWFEISLSDRLSNKKDAGRYGWAACMDAYE